MKEEEKLLSLDLKKEQLKQSLNQPEGAKLYFFRALYSLLQNQGLNDFCDILFTICEFIQLMAFPLDRIFSSGWKTYWYSTIGNFFRYFQLVTLWEGNTQFFLITVILIFLYILFLLISFIHILVKSTSLTYHPKLPAKLVSTLIEFEVILNIPFMRTLFSIFSCQADNLKPASEIACNSNFHICLIIISIILILIFMIFILLFRSTLFEFGTNNNKLKASYTSSTQVLLVIIKLILIILYEFVTSDVALSIMTFIISLLLLIDFFNKQPFSNGFTMKLYFGLYLLFFWSSTICIIAILLKNSKFEGGILLLIIGYPLIIISVSTMEWDFSFYKIFEYTLSKEKDGYKALLEIEFFLKMEETLEDRIRTKPQKILYSYISNYEKNCTVADCPLKQFMKMPLKVENFVEMRICLLQHAETLYKTAVSKFPFNAKLRISYGLFLYNKLNKKLKGTNEITLLNKYNTNLEDSFLVYKAQRFIQDDNNDITNTDSNNNNNINQDNNNSNNINTLTYKPILNNIKSLINKITMNYVDFWTILAISDENKSENFQKMSMIGTKIRKLNEELLGYIEKLENVNLYDQETFKLYIQYLTEILSNNNQANIYNSKLADNEQKKHLYNEDNLFELNYKAMSRSEDYKYIILNCSPPNFNSICNLSLSICSIFGYSKEELIGHSFDNLLPELFSIHHRKLLEDKVEEFKKKLLIKNVKIRSDSWIIDSFIRNKMKYLVPFKVRWTLVSSEDEIIYGIGKVITDIKILMESEQETVYVLTDKDLIINSFTSNAPKLLYLHSSAINNNLDITDYIKEFNEDYISNIDNLIDPKESSISNMSVNSKKRIRHVKLDLLKKMFLGEKDNKKIIHWKLYDVLMNENSKQNKKNGIFGKRSSFARINYGDPKFQSAFLENLGKNKPKVKVAPKRKISVGIDQDIDIPAIKNFNLSNTEDKLPNFDPEKAMDLKDTNISDINVDVSFILNDKKEKVYYNRTHHHKFNLSVKEVKFNEIKVGYIFKFEPYISKNGEEKNMNAHKNNQQISKYDLSTINKQIEYNEIEKSEISVMSFAANKQPLEQRNSLIFQSAENPFGINFENNDSFFMKLNKDKENQFTIDMNKMSYKQLGLIDKNEKAELFEELRLEAVEKVSKAAKQVKNEELSEEEEESSSGSYYSSGDESLIELSSGRKNEEISSQRSIKNVITQEKIVKKSSNNLGIENRKLSVKGSNNNVPVISITPSSKGNSLKINQISLINNTPNNNKHKEEDYYHVDVSNITYYIYNYTSGFIEVIKDQKYKISQVVKQTNAEKEKLSKMNAKYIANPKLAKEKKRGNVNKKIANDDELNSYNEKTIKLKEIQKALTSKEKQSSIIHLCIFSFIIFALVIGTGIMSIMINFHLRDKIFMFYELTKKSIELYKNILFEITFVREMLLINTTYYSNYYDPDIEHYYSNFSNKCYEYYLDSANIISNLTININKLNEKQKNLIINKTIDLYIIDPIESNETHYLPKKYELLLFSAYRELNSALYHISQLTIKEIYTYEDDVYYFIKNGMSNILIYTEELMELLTNQFLNIIKNGNIIIIVCFVVLFVVYIGCFFIFSHFYQKVEERKQSYLSVFYEIGGEYIILSLAKCEKFSQKLQIQEDNIGNQVDKISLDSSSIDDSDIDNDIQTSSIIKQNKDNKISTSNKEKNTKNISLIQTKIIGFIIFFILLLYQYSSYIYYYLRLSLYKNCAKYEYSLTKYMPSFLFPFIGIREYIYDPQKTFYNTSSRQYIEETLKKFYIELTEVSNDKDKYIQYFPNSYTDCLNDLYSNQICDFIVGFIKEYPNNEFINCSDFFYGTSDYGFFSLLTTYIEEIRILKDSVDEYIIKSKEKNFAYNESFFNDPSEKYEKLYEKYRDVEEEYRSLNPANTLNTTSHKTIFIVYRFIIAKVITLFYSKLFITFEGIFSATTKISLIINISFMIVVLIGFSFLWIPFVIEENETIFKTKNMLSIIPNEILITLPHINIMLGIDEENN